MSDVKRYTWSTEDHAMRESAELGDYVRLADYDTLFARCDARGERIDIQQARIAHLEAALRKLRNEVGGLDICKHAIIETVSLTNWECLMLRAREADAALSGARTAKP